MNPTADLPEPARRLQSRGRSWLAGALVVLFAGCSGDITGSGGAPSTPAPKPPGMMQPPTTTPPPTDPMVTPPPPPPPGATASVAPLRRLNAEQYRNTIQDLLGLGDLAPDSALPPDEAIGEERFLSNVRRPVQGSDVDKYADLANAIATKAAAAGATLLGCDGNDAGCIKGFITSFGKRAFRRPLSAAEITRAEAVFNAGRMGADVGNGLRLLISAFLQAPSFLYLVEPFPAGAGGQVVGVDAWAMASRLSFFLLNSMPDQGLFAAAEANQLATPEQIGKEVERLMTTPRFRAMVANFHSQWLEIGELKGATKDAEAFPAFNDELRALMMEEPRRFVEHVMKDGDGKLTTLLTASFSVLSGPLYDLYGVAKPAGAAAGTWAKADLDPKQRAGLFTQAGVMASLSGELRTSFIRRGKLVRAGLLCTPIPDPPAGLDTAEGDVPANADVRQRAAIHRDKPQCASCHERFDELGFAFENYDAIGRWRTMDAGKPVDPSTKITFTKGLDGAVTGPIDMMAKLAGADEVRACVAKQWLRYALGRDEVDADDGASLEAAIAGFKAGDWKVSELLSSIARSSSFRYQKVKP